MKRSIKKPAAPPAPPPSQQAHAAKVPITVPSRRQVVAKRITFGADQEPGTKWKSEMEYIRKVSRVARDHVGCHSWRISSLWQSELIILLSAIF